MKGEVGDSLTIVSYHVSDGGWTNPDGTGRKNAYRVSGTPTVIIDGTELPWNGGADYNYNGFRKKFNELKVVAPDVEIALSGEYDHSTGEGEATAGITNITSGEIEGVCHFVICQKDTPFVWQSEDYLHYIERKMLPDYNGTEVTVAPDETEEVTQSFTIEESWERDDCYLTVFVQNSSGEVLQAIEIDLDKLVPTAIDPDVTFGNINKTTFFSIRPNPVYTNLRLTLFQKVASIDIIDSKGSIRKTVRAKGRYTVIPVGDLGSGIYYCVTKENGRIQKEQFIKF